jgi:hypothetical protein
MAAEAIKGTEYMPYIPKGSEWYIARLVLEIVVEGDERNVVHTNYTLIRAENPDDALASALGLGRDSETSYLNPLGQLVRIQFIGVRSLNVVYESLEHGAELLFEEEVGVSKQELAGRIPRSEQLTVFCDPERLPHPNYASAAIRKEAEKLMTERSNDRPSQEPSNGDLTLSEEKRGH